MCGFYGCTALGIAKREVCKPLRYPTPFSHHYSDRHKEAVLTDMQAYIAKMQGTDKDFGAHFTIINRCVFRCTVRR